MGILALSLIYWLVVIVLLFIGLIRTITAKTPEKRKSGITMLIISVVMMVIGGTACGIMLSGLGNMH